MVLKHREGDLCKAYRPQTFSEVVGQTAIVKSLRNAIRSENHAQCYLFMGEKGCGKTTIARIMGMALNCTNLNKNGDPCCICNNCKNIASESHMDFREINASSQNSVNDIRKIEQEIKTSPLFGKVKIYLFDEAHRLTTEAQNALLKDTEDMPKGVYIFLCSTEPHKIIGTLRDRCETYHFKLLPSSKIKHLIETVGVFENYYPSEKILNTIIKASDNRPRNALRVLQKVLHLSKEGTPLESELLDIIGVMDETDKEVIDLCRLLTSKNTPSWDYIMKVYKKIKVDKEIIRLVLAGWFRSKVERAKTVQSASVPAQVLSLFIDPLPPIKPENKLVLNIYNAYTLLHVRKDVKQRY